MIDNETRQKVILLFRKQLSLLFKFKADIKRLQYIFERIQRRDGKLKVVDKKDLLEFKGDVKHYEGFLNSCKKSEQTFILLEKLRAIPSEYIQTWKDLLSESELLLAFCAQSCIVSQSLDFKVSDEYNEIRDCEFRGIEKPRRAYDSYKYKIYLTAECEPIDIDIEENPTENE